MNISILIIFSILLSSCSVGMALSGNEQKDTSVFYQGAVQHLFRNYLSTGEYPSKKEIRTMTRSWKDIRIKGISNGKENKVGFEEISL